MQHKNFLVKIVCCKLNAENMFTLHFTPYSCNNVFPWYIVDLGYMNFLINGNRTDVLSKSPRNANYCHSSLAWNSCLQKKYSM